MVVSQSHSYTNWLKNQYKQLFALPCDVIYNVLEMSLTAEDRLLHTWVSSM